MGDDPDRAAILGRRNRLIALALSGIGAAAGCGDPVPCLAPPPVEPTVVDEQHTGPVVPDEPVTHPTPCLAPPPAPREEPPRDETVPEDEPTVNEAATEPPPVPRPRRPGPLPQPCLSAPIGPPRTP